MNNISGFSNAFLANTQFSTSDPATGSDPAASDEQSNAFGDVLAGLSQRGDNQQASSSAPNTSGWKARGGDIFSGGDGASNQDNSFGAGRNPSEAGRTKNPRKRAHSAKIQRSLYQTESSQIAKLN